MQGNTPRYIRHIYKVERELKGYVVYSLDKVENTKNLLTPLIRIEKFRGKSNTYGISEYLRLRNTSNWSKCSLITGLRPIKGRNLFYGDCKTPNLIGNNSKTLMFFEFTKCRSNLTIYVFKDYYPIHKGILKNIAVRIG